jgi:O-antigen/teichoic acid export membrane protein
MNEILTIWISASYATQYSKVFSLLIVAYGLLSLCRPGHQTLTGIGRVRFTSLVYLFSTISMLIGVYVFSRNFGLYGAASANCFMILLLAYNIASYKLLGAKQFSWRAVLDDLKWGFFLPAIIFGLLFINHTFLLRLQITFVLVIVLFIVLSKDDWAKLLLAHQFKRINRTLPEN